MDCKECKKLITEKFTGSLPKEQEELVKKHIEQCPECMQLYEREQEISTSLRELDSRAFRTESIMAFSRLALMVRSYRTPRSVFDGIYQIRGMKTASAIAAIFLILLGLSSLNFSYSYTNGTSMQISFDPPLEKLESINTDEFNTRINNAIDNVIKDSKDKGRVSWAVAIERDSLKSISVDVQTSRASEVVNIYDSLLNQYPSLSLGQVSVSPLKENVNAPIYTYIIGRKKNTIDDEEIRKVVKTDFQTIMTKVDNRNNTLDMNTDRIQQILEGEIPAIRQLIREFSDDLTKTGEASVNTSVIDSPAMMGGAQVEKKLSKQISSEYIKHEIKHILERNGLILKKQDFNRLLHVEYDAPFTRIMIGDTGELFSPKVVGGWGLTIIRGSGADIRLNGLGDVIKSTEIDDVLNGTIEPKVLESSILGRLEKAQLQNEKVVIEAWKGDKRAEIIVSPVDVQVQLISEPISDVDSENENSDVTQQMVDSKAPEREIVFQSSDNTNAQNDRKVLPPSFSDQYGILPSYILEEEIEKLLEGKITSEELESTIEKRLGEKNIDPGYQNIFLVRNGKAITINLVDGNARIEVGEWKSSKSNDNSVIVTFKDEDARSSNTKETSEK